MPTNVNESMAQYLWGILAKALDPPVEKNVSPDGPPLPPLGIPGVPDNAVGSGAPQPRTTSRAGAVPPTALQQLIERMNSVNTPALADVPGATPGMLGADAPAPPPVQQSQNVPAPYPHASEHQPMDVAPPMQEGAGSSFNPNASVPIPDFLQGEVMEEEPLPSPELGLESIVGSPVAPVGEEQDQIALAQSLNERPRRGNPGWVRTISAILSRLGRNEQGAQQVENQPHQDALNQWQDRIQKLHLLAEQEKSGNQLDLENFRIGQEREFRQEQAGLEQDRFNQRQADIRRGQDVSVRGQDIQAETAGKRANQQSRDRKLDRDLKRELAGEQASLSRELNDARIAARGSGSTGKRPNDQTLLQMLDQHTGSYFLELPPDKQKIAAKYLGDAIKYNITTKKFDFDISRVDSTWWGTDPEIRDMVDNWVRTLRESGTSVTITEEEE